jgi:hypothetical protein
MNYRDAKMLENGWIDCEIEHPTHGWIPFTCASSDTGADFDVAALHAEMLADPATAPYVPPTEAEILYEQTLEARYYRSQLLTEIVDPIATNPLRWGDLSQERKDEVSAYRRALLDITDQAGFPSDIVWPEVPSFLA